MNLRCGQKGCEFEADEAPSHCPVCNNPYLDADAEVIEPEPTWDDYTVDELREQLTEWEVEGWTSRTSKADLIELAMEAEAALGQEIDYDEFDIDELRVHATEGELEGWDDDTTREELIELLEAAAAADDDDDD